MDIILLEKVHNLGNLGDRVKVKPGYGRNFLIPGRKAVAATVANVARFEAEREKLEQAQADQLSQAQARAAALADASVTVAGKAGTEGRLFGSVGTADIADAFTSTGVEVAKREVRLPAGGLREVGEHQVELHLHADVNVTVTVRIIAEQAPRPASAAAPDPEA
jgi:large subunit ribosomal protein L9